MFTKSFVLAMGCSALAFGCAGGSEQQEIVDNLVQAGFPASDIQVVGDKVYVGHDAEVSLQASIEMLDGAGGEEQFRTTNLVGGAPNTRIICVNGSAFTNATLSAGLNEAINNYNVEFNAGRSRLQFRRTPSAGTCNFTINGVQQAGLTGGSAGFPSGGAPFGQIIIGTGVAQFGVDVAEHVITHELGHCIGFRHSDFFNRSISCGGAATNEGQAGVGAILIAGTPSTAVIGGSIMNSCFRSVETGEFTGSDVTAINALY